MSTTTQKYVRHSNLGFILWPKTDALWHEHMGRLLTRVPGKIMSAGFADVQGGTARCFGRSESLDMDSDPSDSVALALQLGLETV